MYILLIIRDGYGDGRGLRDCVKTLAGILGDFLDIAVSNPTTQFKWRVSSFTLLVFPI